MKIARLMKKEAIAFKENTSVRDAAKSLLSRKEDMAVVYAKGSPIGVVTSTDLMRQIAKGKSLKAKVSSMMTSPIKSVTPYADPDDVLLHMDAARLRKYPVIIGSRLMGTVSLHDVITHQNHDIRFHRMVQNAVLVTFVAFEVLVFFLFGVFTVMA